LTAVRRIVVLVRRVGAPAVTPHVKRSKSPVRVAPRRHKHGRHAYVAKAVAGRVVWRVLQGARGGAARAMVV
jgi:hypothetical protein